MKEKVDEDGLRDKINTVNQLTTAITGFEGGGWKGVRAGAI